MACCSVLPARLHQLSRLGAVYASPCRAGSPLQQACVSEFVGLLADMQTTQLAPVLHSLDLNEDTLGLVQLQFSCLLVDAGT